MRVVYLTAGAGGMFCGSCLHDNTLARALSQLDVDIQLLPTYTPIRTDEQDVSLDRVYFGGINVFLQQKIPLFRYLPRFMDRWLDQPWLIKWVTSFGMETDAAQLGALTVSMLKGTAGFQKKEVLRLCSWLDRSPRPDLINLSNMLIAGSVPEMKRRLDVPVLVTLQGDDVFLESLSEPFKSQAFAQIANLVPQIDGFVVFSQYYADFMREYFSIPAEKIHIVPLGLDTRDFEPAAEPVSHPESSPVIGYLARLAPEKGLHRLIDAFVHLRRDPEAPPARLRIAGWLGEGQKKFAEQQFRRLADEGLADDYEYVGTIERDDKLRFLRSLDVLSVPTTYQEPKGLFVLEALACGVPVIQPAHGAFPELLNDLGGGHLVPPDDPQALADQLKRVLLDRAGSRQLGEAGRVAILSRRDARHMAEATRDVYAGYCRPS